ncbi:MAG: long-chain fatty acid--CoA ligase [Acidobacteriia bacterium]|nr:long-chain fatty acid--CoA ligase [Terriglobia bacterium]
MPSEATIVHSFWKHVRTRPEQTALRVKRGGRYIDITWGEFGRSVRHLAAALTNQGVREGEVIAILSNNRPEWAMVDLAILTLGAISVSIYATNVPKDTAHILSHSGAKLVVVENRRQLEKIKEIRTQAPSLEKAVIIDATGVSGGDDFLILWDDFLREGERLEVAHPVNLDPSFSRLHREQLAIIIYTSGTTGPPKGVMLAHDNLMFVCETLSNLNMISDRDVFFSFLPLAHALERLGSLYLPVYLGAQVGYAERMETVPENLAELAPTVVTGVPRFFEKALERILATVASSPGFKRALFQWAIKVGREATPYQISKLALPPRLRFKHWLADRLAFQRLRKRLGGRLRFFASGGAPLSREVLEFFHAVGLPIFEAYGATETTSPTTVSDFDHFKFGTVGKPLPGVDVRIADDGEILVRGRNVFLGYFKDPRATQEALVDGWYHTGDIGRIDDEGFLTILDRKKELIITSAGKNISPQNIENLLKHDPLISQAMVVGDRRNYLTALLTLSAETLPPLARRLGVGEGTYRELTEHPQVIERIADIVNRVNQQLARFEQIKKFRILPVDFSEATGELTPTLKLRRKFIAEKYSREISRLYEESRAAPTGRS